MQRGTTRHHSKTLFLTLPDATVGGQLLSASKYFEIMSGGSLLRQTDPKIILRILPGRGVCVGKGAGLSKIIFFFGMLLWLG